MERTVEVNGEPITYIIAPNSGELMVESSTAGVKTFVNAKVALTDEAYWGLYHKAFGTR